MLKQMRQKEFAKKVLWVVTFIIIISFGFLGTAYMVTTGFGINSAGKIYGKNIPMMDFENAFRDVRIQAIMRYGDNFRQVQQYLDFDTETWDRLILLHEANRRKIKVTNEEIIKAIEEYQFFQRNGQFDTLLYNDILRYVFKVRAREFEESVRNNLRLQKLLDAETKDITVSEADVLAQYDQQNAKVKVSYVLINGDKFINEAQFDEAKAKEYFEANQSAFLKAPSINVDYISFPIPQAKTPEGENAAEDLAAPIRQQAQDALAKINTEKNLEKTAQDLGLTINNTGYFSANEPNLALGWSFDVLGKLFDGDIGMVDGPIETPSAIYIIKLKDKRDAYVPTFEEARDQIRQVILKMAAQDIAKQKAQEQLVAIKTALSTNNSFSDTVKSLGLEMNETPSFTRGQYLPKVGISKDFQDTAFNLDMNNRLSEVIETGIGYAIIYLDEKTSADKEQFEKDKAALTESMLSTKKSEVFSEFMTRLRLQAKLKDNISKLRQQAGQ